MRAGAFLISGYVTAAPAICDASGGNSHKASLNLSTHCRDGFHSCDVHGDDSNCRNARSTASRTFGISDSEPRTTVPNFHDCSHIEASRSAVSGKPRHPPSVLQISYAPSGEFERIGPAADAGEEMALIVSADVAGADIGNGAFIDIAFGNQPRAYQFPEPCRRAPVVFVVVRHCKYTEVFHSSLSSGSCSRSIQAITASATLCQ